jgi:cytochrome b involved in lipid metabolism
MAIYTLSEVEKHKDRGQGVWMVIHDKVYDVTKFLGEVRRIFSFVLTIK